MTFSQSADLREQIRVSLLALASADDDLSEQARIESAILLILQYLSQVIGADDVACALSVATGIAPETEPVATGN